MGALSNKLFFIKAGEGGETARLDKTVMLRRLKDCGLFCSKQTLRQFRNGVNDFINFTDVIDRSVVELQAIMIKIVTRYN